MAPTILEYTRSQYSKKQYLKNKLASSSKGQDEVNINVKSVIPPIKCPTIPLGKYISLFTHHDSGYGERLIN